MKVNLFHAPYVDEDGQSRQRLSAVLTGFDPDAGDRELVDSLAKGIREIESGEARVLALPDDIEVGWL